MSLISQHDQKLTMANAFFDFLCEHNLGPCGTICDWHWEFFRLYVLFQHTVVKKTVISKRLKTFFAKMAMSTRAEIGTQIAETWFSRESKDNT
jgi:hypothetical protein